MKALLRCSNPELAAAPIDNVIDLAREAGLMKILGQWVMNEACTQFKKWKDNGLTNARMCVNLCSDELIDPETPKMIDEILTKTALQPGDLEIELTERQALEVEKKGMESLQVIRSRGIAIALDDFGTGYSALSYLRNLPVSAVKLDKSFLVGIPEDRQGCAVIKAILALSHALGLEVAAEDVETEDQASLLKAYNCTTLQGFLISRPLSAEDMTAWLFGKSKTIH